MSAKSWPKVKKVINHGKTAYMVDARIAGKGSRQFFPTKAEAESWAQVQRIRRENQGHAAFDDSELARFGWTVADAIKFTLDHLRRTEASVSVAEAASRLIESKRAKGRDAVYCADLQRRLSKLIAVHGNDKIASITVEQMTAFLDGLPLSAETRNTVRRDCVTLWSHAVKMGWASKNVPQVVERATVVEKPPGILTPEQAARLLAESEGDLLAFHTIGLFAGLRVAELRKLDWKDVDLDGGYIHVSAEKSKTRTRRLVPILPNLREWLAPLAQRSGPVFKSSGRQRIQSARKRAGIVPWPDNAMRHSFVSYRLAATGNAAQTALESGHDQDVLFRHYREIVKPKAAETYFSIAPHAPANVVNMAA